MRPEPLRETDVADSNLPLALDKIPIVGFCPELPATKIGPELPETTLTASIELRTLLLVHKSVPELENRDTTPDEEVAEQVLD